MGDEGMPRRRGFTYIELMIGVVVVAILVVVALPDEEAAAGEEARQFALRYQADLEYARSLTIARPDDPMVLKVDAANDRYWLARRSAPDTPIQHPRTKKPYIVQAGDTGPAGSKRVSIEGVDFDGGDVLEFEPMGGTTGNANGLLELKSGEAKYEVATSPAGGKSDVKSEHSNEEPAGQEIEGRP